MNIIDLEKLDPSFSQDEFLSMANQRIKMILNAITLNEVDQVKHFMNWEVYDAFNDTLQSYEDDGDRLIYDEVNVDSQISTVREEEETYVISVDANCQYIKFVIDGDGNILQGDPDSRVSVTHKITFQKRKDARPLEDVVRCLGCGTSLNIGESGICPNCGRTFDLDQFDFVITEWK